MASSNVNEPYRTAISNIAWGRVDEAPFLRYAASQELYGIEVAPSLVWDEPAESSAKQRRAYRKNVESFGLCVVSLHALLFTRPDLAIFGDRQTRAKTTDYLASLAALAEDLGCGLMVLGSPKNRRRGALDKAEADRMAEEFFRETAERCRSHGVRLCIEPLSKAESDYINDHREGIELVKRVGHPNFRLMLDIKSMHLEGEDYAAAFRESAGYMEHVHVNDPGNRPPGSTGVDHTPIAAALRQSGYSGALSLEVGRDVGEPMQNVRQSIEVLRRVYCGVQE